MNKQTLGEIKKIVADALNEVVVPVLEKLDEKTDRMETKMANMETNMATKEDIDRLERKYNSTENRLDDHGQRIEVLEKQASIAS